MSPKLEYVMTPHVATGTVIEIAEITRDGEQFAGIYLAPETGDYIAVFSWRTPAIWNESEPYNMLIPPMGQDVSIPVSTGFRDVHKLAVQMANLEFRPI
jgi:hypothetical protein